MKNTKFKIYKAGFSYGRSSYPVEQVNLIRFPQTVSLATLAEDSEQVIAGLVKLGGNHETLRTIERISVEQNGISFEGDGWHVVYKLPEQ
jgi:hypothetical protein